MGLLSWFRAKTGLLAERLQLTDPIGWRRFMTQTWSGRPVTLDSSLQLSTWWRCVKLYAEVTGACSLKFYERGDGDERQQMRDHQVAQLIAIDPNSYQTAQEFWSNQAAALAALGNAYAEKRMVGDRVVSLEPLPWDTYPRRTLDDRLEYVATDRGRQFVLPPEKVFHTKGFTIGKADVGLSPLAYGRQSLGITLATEEATGKTFAHGMRASGFFTTPPGVKLTDKQRGNFRETFITPLTGNDAEVHIGLLEGGTDFKTINIAPKDAEMLLSRKFNVEELCRFMGVPPILVGHAAEGQTMWGSGVENIILSWLTLGLDAFLKNIESSINKRLLTSVQRRRFFAEFDRNSLMRANSQARAEFISRMIQFAQLTPNEGRAKENLPPVPGANELLVNSTMIPLRLAGQTAPPPPPTEEDDDEDESLPARNEGA